MNLAKILEENPYFRGLKGQQIIYSVDFYLAMYEKIRSGMTYVESYNALGFDTTLLGINQTFAVF